MHNIRMSEVGRSELLLDAIEFNLDTQVHIRGCSNCAAIDDLCPVAKTMLAEYTRKIRHLTSLGLLG